MVYFIKVVSVHTGEIQCLERTRRYLVRRLNFIIIKSSSIMSYRMDNVLTVHGIEHDEN